MVCNSCGGDLAPTDKVCKYCGAENPSYVAPKKSFFDTSSTTTDPSSGSNEVPPQKSNINWVVFIVLMVTFWPAAIIYAIVKSLSK